MAFFYTLIFCLFVLFYFFALGLFRQFVRTEWDETASQRLGRFLAPQHQPQRPSGDAGMAFSHWKALIYHIHILPGNPSEGTIALEENSPGTLVAFGGQHFTDHRPLWRDDNLSLTSTRVLCTLMQQEVENHDPAIVLRSHYRQTEQK